MRNNLNKTHKESEATRVLMVWWLLICFSDNVGDERGQGDPRSSQDLPDPRMIEVAHLLPSISLFMWSEKFHPPPLPSIYKCDVID